MGWSFYGETRQGGSAATNDSYIDGYASISWSGGSSFAYVSTSTVRFRVGDSAYGSGYSEHDYNVATSVNYVSYYPYYGSGSGSQTLVDWTRLRSFTHGSDGWREAKWTHSYYYNSYIGSFDYNSADYGIVDYDRSANTPTMGTTTRDSTTSATIRYNQNGSVNGPTTYVVQRATDAGFANVDKTWTNPAVGFTDSTLNANTTYYYRVYAYGDEGGNKYSSPTGALYGQPTPPLSVNVATNSSTSGAINVWWTAPSNQQRGVDYYHVYRDGPAGSGTYVGTWNSGTAPTSSNPFVDTGAGARTSHTYYVYAHTTDFWSNVSTPSVSTVAASVPSAPSSITGPKEKLSLKVGRNVTIEYLEDSSFYNNPSTGYFMQFSTDNGLSWHGWDNINRVRLDNEENPVSGGSFTYEMLTPALTYKWRVYAKNSIGIGDLTRVTPTGTFISAGGRRYRGTGEVNQNTWQPTETAKRWDPTLNSNAGGWKEINTAKRWDTAANSGNGGWVDLT